MVCECSRSSVESLACTCVLCCNLVKHYIFLAHMLRACMHGALPKVSGGWMLRVKKSASNLLDHANTLHHSFTWIFGFDTMVGITRSNVFFIWNHVVLFRAESDSCLSWDSRQCFCSCRERAEELERQTVSNRRYS